jgi:hypothetical protein
MANSTTTCKCDKEKSFFQNRIRGKGAESDRSGDKEEKLF